MSDVVERVYTGRSGHVSARRRRTKRRSGCFTIVLFLVLLTVAYGCWITRDTHSVGGFIPARQKYRCAVTDLLEKRTRVGHSALWRLVPKNTPLAELPEILESDFDFPDWVLNNVVGPNCYFAGDSPADMVFATKMSPVGCLIERPYRFSADVTPDHAGGLNLREVPRKALYYAVRGRVLLLSRSRNALIRSLTLREQDAAGDDALADTFAQAGAEDVRGVVNFDPGAMPGDLFTSVSFALQLNASDATLQCRAALRPEWRNRGADLLNGVGPSPLIEPADAMLQISANFNKDLRAIWLSLGPLFESEVFSAVRWNTWENGASADLPGLAQMLANTLGTAGPAFTLNWHGVDLNEIIPVPEILGVFQTPDTNLDKIAERLPLAVDGRAPWNPRPGYDAIAKRITLPMMGGLSIEPTVALYGEHLLVSTSRSVADILLQTPDNVALMPEAENGNLFVRIRPGDCAEAVAAIGRTLAENHLLRGHSIESFSAYAAERVAQARQIREISLHAYHKNGTITATFKLSMTDER
ncbi:MAG TPA: hypothetical protein HPP77_00060 [Candidatus Hydrogenedentes bacterium]|nr:hypothetical protein [Candidatus Hydrogenedentota bacterium]